MTRTSESEPLLTRVFDAPRNLVWEAWTQPEHIAQWWGPAGFSTRVEELDLRAGGRWRYVMIGPDGAEYPSRGVFRAVVPAERIATTDDFDEAFELPDGGELPRGIVVTCVFEDLGTRTRLTLSIVHPNVEERRKHAEMGVVEGWRSSFDCLAEHLQQTGPRQRGR
jgi:uncharacterized protein YndB with AHSA1/START domain